VNEVSEIMAEILSRASLLPEETEEQRIDRERSEAAERDAAARAQSIRWMSQCGISLRVAEILVDETTLDTPPMLAARSWWSSDKTILVLAGSKGVGKTVAAGWVASQDPYTWPQLPKLMGPYPSFSGPKGAMSWRVGPLFRDAVALSRVNRYKPEEVDELVSAATLVVDDLGVEFNDQKGAFASLLDEVVNSRYGNKLKTCLTTNLTAADFKARFGERIADRIREAGTWFEQGGVSLRGKRA
jgi:hypothetical protein